MWLALLLLAAMAGHGRTSIAGPAVAGQADPSWLVGRWMRPHQDGLQEMTWTAIGGDLRGVVFDVQRGQSRRVAAVYELKHAGATWTLRWEEGAARFSFSRLYADGQHLRFERRGRTGPPAVEIAIVGGKLFVGHAAGGGPSPTARRDLWFERAPSE
ncbi:MAG TPA: hypothetical protein VGL59_11515 [Polyangia bacterium]